MRFNLLPLLLLAPASLAAPVENTASGAQDIRVIEGAILDVVKSLNGLSTAVTGLQRNSGRGDTTRNQIEIERGAARVTDDLRQGADKIRRAPTPNEIEAATLVQDVERLIAATVSSVSAITAAKPAVVRAGGQQPVLRLLMEMETASDQFTAAMVAKMPPLARARATLYGTQSRVIRATAIETYRRPF